MFHVFPMSRNQWLTNRKRPSWLNAQSVTDLELVQGVAAKDAAPVTANAMLLLAGEVPTAMAIALIAVAPVASKAICKRM